MSTLALTLGPNSWVLVVGISLFLITVGVFRNTQKADRKRIAELPGETTVALADARKVTSGCYAMRGATAFAKELTLNLQSCFPSEELKPANGPRERDLLLRAKTKSIKALKKGCRLSVEGLRLTTDAQYSKMRSLFWSALVSCQKCKPEAGCDKCIALIFLEKIELN